MEKRREMSVERIEQAGELGSDISSYMKLGNIERK
jgi:hypothetical protein